MTRKRESTMVKLMYRQAHWNYWSELYFPNRMTALDERNRLRSLGYQAEVI